MHVFTLAYSIANKHFELTFKGSICHKYQPLDQVNEEGKLTSICETRTKVIGPICWASSSILAASATKTTNERQSYSLDFYSV